MVLAEPMHVLDTFNTHHIPVVDHMPGYMNCHTAAVHMLVAHKPVAAHMIAVRRMSAGCHKGLSGRSRLGCTALATCQSNVM